MKYLSGHAKHNHTCSCEQNPVGWQQLYVQQRVGYLLQLAEHSTLQHRYCRLVHTTHNVPLLTTHAQLTTVAAAVKWTKYPQMESIFLCMYQHSTARITAKKSKPASTSIQWHSFLYETNNMLVVTWLTSIPLGFVWQDYFSMVTTS